MKPPEQSPGGLVRGSFCWHALDRAAQIVQCGEQIPGQAGCGKSDRLLPFPRRAPAGILLLGKGAQQPILKIGHLRLEFGNPAGRPVLLLHGYTDTSRVWSIVAPWLADHRLLIPDQRGHGASSAPDCCYALAEFADDARLFLDAMGVCFFASRDSSSACDSSDKMGVLRTARIGPASSRGVMWITVTPV